MPSGKKRKRHKVATHKRKKRRRNSLLGVKDKNIVENSCVPAIFLLLKSKKNRKPKNEERIDYIM